MSFAHPLLLVLLLPAFGLVAWLTLWRGGIAMTLPGHWQRAIGETMQGYMARQVISQVRLPVVLWLGIWTLLIVGLARPILDFGEPTDYGNLAGRVIALDLGSGFDVEEQKLIAYRILDAAPSVPTALVVATAEAFDVVPFTTDRAHLDRYLQVIKPDLMPVSGRAPGIAITHAESMFARAGMVVGQLVLVTGGGTPPADANKAGDWLRALIVDRNSLDTWDRFADAIDARLTDDSEIDGILNDLDGEVAKALRDSEEAADLALLPWLIGVSALLWLGFFRRIRST